MPPSPPPTCVQCGAAVPVPEDLAAVVARCTYCGTEQPVPDLEVRRRALAREQREADARAQANEVRADVRAQTQSAMRIGKLAALPGLLIGAVAMIGAFSAIYRTVIAPGLGSSLGASVGPAAGVTWDGTSAFVCGGVAHQRITGVTASLGGVAIYARDNCHLVLEGCRLRAGTVIEASGNAHVTLQGGSAEGAPTLADVSGNAHVENHGARTGGAVHRSANGRVTGL